MLDESEIDSAIEVANRAYKLLVWLAGAIESGFIGLEHAGAYIGDPAAARSWLKKHYADFPQGARPNDREGRELDRFANYFASYLNASFDLHEVTGTMLITGPGGYCCELCGHRVPRSHIQPKKLDRRDKQKAQQLMTGYLKTLASTPRST